MSEYQYYEFTAVDRPLTTREQSELRSLSTRADITATSFVNTYEWGNFKGDPRKLMERYFDAHLYLANWGTRELMLRLPKRVLDPAVVADYCVGDSASAWTNGKHLIIGLNREDEDGTDEWDIGGEGLLASIIGVRTSLAAGDLRLLYLGWLRCVQSLGLSDDGPEPSVPAGLATLDAPLTAVAEFLCIDRDLITAAAAGSPSATAAEPTSALSSCAATSMPMARSHPPRPPHAPPVNYSPLPMNCARNGNVATHRNGNATGSAGSAPRPPPGNDTWTPTRPAPAPTTTATGAPTTSTTSAATTACTPSGSTRSAPTPSASPATTSRR